ncbi:hypothetical protein TNIN_192731 [Trichonephila inaurata madagascariensis]|uniref:Uncharacterized protein n=1 Tax=Trichonephila inaurata madagascariensis TaxID=2747483 RepID=A0A8X6XSZ3_9ARAC|nr:hypothetical protein TNIN_192731 [Trichonephila inaurata madagascariensis]
MESEASSFYEEAEKIGFQQIAIRMSERVNALQFPESPHLYRNEKETDKCSFRCGTGARRFCSPNWEHFARLQFLDDTIEPHDSTSNLDYMELEINAVHSIGMSSTGGMSIPENVVELPPIPCSEFLSEQPQGARVSPSTPLMSTSKPRAKKKKG